MAVNADDSLTRRIAPNAREHLSSVAQLKNAPKGLSRNGGLRAVCHARIELSRFHHRTLPTLVDGRSYHINSHDTCHDTCHDTYHNLILREMIQYVDLMYIFANISWLERSTHNDEVGSSILPHSTINPQEHQLSKKLTILFMALRYALCPLLCDTQVTLKMA